MNSKLSNQGNNNGKISLVKITSVILQQILWLTWLLTLVISCLGISWQVSKSVNFAYGFWYQHLEINKTITNNVVKNSQGKRDFPVDNVKLHQKKFADIVNAIHDQGHGLSDISYKTNLGQSRQLLTASEIQHLQDVANLLDKVVKVWCGSIVLLFLLLFIYYRFRVSKSVSVSQSASLDFSIATIAVIPSVKQKLISVFALAVFIVVILLLWGFTAVFYYLHTVVFPADHQWFFYYHESLMSTIMKAPDIFAAIAGQLLIVALVLSITIEQILSRCLIKN